MQATCENCGKIITPEDFSHGRYFLFWITPTVPSESLYLCEVCRGLSWAEREALFDAWMERRESGPARKPRPVRRRRAKRAQAKPGALSSKSPSPAPAVRAFQRRTKKQPAAAKPRADQEDAPWWEDPEQRRQKLQELAQMALELR